MGLPSRRQSPKKICPAGDRLLVRRWHEPAAKKDDAEQLRDRPIRATIVAVGPGYLEDGERLPLVEVIDPDRGGTSDVEVGDTIIFPEWCGYEIEQDGEKLYIVECCEVMAVERDA